MDKTMHSLRVFTEDGEVVLESENETVHIAPCQIAALCDWLREAKEELLPTPFIITGGVIPDSWRTDDGSLNAAGHRNTKPAG